MTTTTINTMATTWNDGGYNVAIKVTVTDTSSTATSDLMDLRVGASSMFKVQKDGRVFAEPEYGIISAQANSTAETTVDGTARKIEGWNTTGSSNLMVASHTDKTIQSKVNDTYEARASLSFSGTASKTFRLELYKYDDSAASWSATGFAVERKLGAGGDVGSCSILGVVDLDVDDKLAVYQKSTDGGSAMTVTEAQLYVKRIST